MGSSSSVTLLSLCLLFIFFRSPARADKIFVSSITANFTSSYLQYIDNSGAFLASENGSFQGRITNSKPESPSYYFVVIHVTSHTIIWTANRNRPISQSSQLRLTAEGLSLYNDTSQPFWSTPRSRSPVSSMKLLESGNLLLLDSTENTVWQSFDFPTDSLVAGQRLRVGKSLVAASSGGGELSEGSYRFVVGGGDATLQWNGMVYWKFSMEGKAFRETALPVEFLTVNVSGVFLMGGGDGNGGEVVIKRIFNSAAANSSDFFVAKLDYSGLLTVVSFDSADGKRVFEGPVDKCLIPMVCRRLGVCSYREPCSCAPGFRNDVSIDNGDCVPMDTSLSLPASCNNGSSSSDGSGFKYLSLRGDLDYFSNGLSGPMILNVNVSFCQSLCSENCSCLGVFHAPSSGSCYMILNHLGSMKPSGSGDRVGYIKLLSVRGRNFVDREENKSDFPTLVVILLLSIGAVLLLIASAAIIFLLRTRRRRRLLRKRASSNDEMDLVSIPGFPVRLDYKEVAEATQGLSSQIGSGGFGTVYRGTLRGGGEVAVKKIRSLEAQGKREFLAEIDVIGKIRHVNLVKLKGYCVHNDQRFLVFEYMNRGSLDQTLFHGEVVLEWKDRYKIALGAARGLEYLHSGCESKIIHCDVKPENILLNDQLHVKVSDFGLSKLIGREQSGFFTTLRGTRGYVAPEWLTNTPISDKTDVYSYGMVLLEIISGVRNFSLQNHANIAEEHHEEFIVSFPLRALKMHMERRYMELVDFRLEGNASSEEVERLVRVALCCLHRDPDFRPSMGDVVRMLQGETALCEPRIGLLNLLRSYGVVALAENNQTNELALDIQEMSSVTTSDNSFSDISSQQVSGPR